MPAHKKKKGPKNCRICGKLFTSAYAFQDVCAKCESTLPRCDSCQTVMAREHGYMEGFARQVGRYKICTSCDVELIDNERLRISESQTLLPSGRVETKAVPPEDKV
jgi:hypothetical protein